MKRLIKVAAVLGVVGVVLTAGAAVAIRRALPPEKARALVVEQARKALKRDVRLTGLSVGILRGAVIEGLEVSADPDFSKGVFAAAKEIAVKPQLLPLLRGEVLVDRVSVDGLRLTVTRRKDGSWVIPGVAVSTAPPSEAGKPAAAPAKLEVRRARVSDAQVTFIDELRGERWEVSGFDARVDGFGLDRPFMLALSGRVKGKTGGRPVDGRLALDGRFDLAGGDLLKASAKLKKLEVEESGLLLEASGQASGTGPSADLSLSLSQEGAQVFSGALKAAAPGKDGFSDAEFDLAAGKGLAAALKRYGLGGYPIPPGLSVKGKARVSPDEAEVSSFALSSGWGTAQGKARASALQSGKPVLRASADLKLDLPAFSAADLPPGTLPEGARTPPLGLEGAVALDGEDAEARALKVRTPWGPAQLDGTVKGLRAARPAVSGAATFKLDLPAFSAADLPKGLLPAGLKVPPLGLEGAAKVAGEDASVSGLKIRTPWGPAQVDGAVRGFRSEKPEPSGSATFDLDLPAWKSADIPLAAVPPGLEVPAGKLTGKVEGSLEEAKLRPVRVKIGSNDLEVEGSVKLKGAAPSGALMLKCRSFVLDELTRVSPRTRELKLKGKGLFALAVTGTLSKPTLAGKLQFSGLGADAGGVELSEFGGTVSFDERRIDAPSIKGLLAGDQVSVDVTIRDYVRRPSVELIAELVRLDVGKLLAAQQALKRPAAPPAGTAGTVRGDTGTVPIDAKGRITVGQVVHPNATASDAKISWELEGITPTFKELNGWAKLSSGSGRFQDLGGLASQSKLLKVAIFPLMVLQKIGIPGIFPNLDRLSYQEMAGDYAFSNGRMQIRESHLYATDLHAESVGSIDLPTERLDITVTAQVGRVAPIDIGVTGTFSDPKAKPKIGKMATDALKGLFKIP